MQFQGFDAVTATGNVALTTTSETVIISSNPVPIEYTNANVLILAWAQLTTGTNTTTVTARIRRGTTTSGTLVGEANAETIKVSAGGTEPFYIMAVDNRANENQVQYSLTLQQAGADGNGSALQAGIVTFTF